jgi:hypothetical protein
VSPAGLLAEALEATKPADGEPENHCGSDKYGCVHDDSPYHFSIEYFTANDRAPQ